MDVLWELLALARHALLVSWLAAAIFWGIAGWAIAVWGRIPGAIGAAAGAIFPVVGTAVIAVVVLARQGGKAAEKQVVRYQSNRAVKAGGSAGAASFGWSSGDVPAVPAAPLWATDPPGTGPLAAASLPVSESATDTSGVFGWPSSGEDDDATNDVMSGLSISSATSASPRRGVPAWFLTVAVLSPLVVMCVLLAVSLFSHWLYVANVVRLGSITVGAALPIIITIIVVMLAGAGCWRRPHGWIAVLVAWFSTWWLVLGLTAVTATSDLSAALGSLVSFDVIQNAATSIGITLDTATFAHAVELGSGPYIMLGAAVAGIVWSVLSLFGAEGHLVWSSYPTRGSQV